jgi:hypothetical protein
VRPDGYIDVWDPRHPLARRDGYLMEHRRMAWDAGLLTDRRLEVHHQNHIRDDNRLDNFEIKTGADHARDHAEERGFVTNQYGTWPVKVPELRKSAPRATGRTCRRCNGPIDDRKRSDAVFCGSGCQVARWKTDSRACA